MSTVVTLVVTYFGGSNALSAITILAGFPVMFILFAILISFIRGLVFRERYDITLTTTETMEGAAE